MLRREEDQGSGREEMATDKPSEQSKPAIHLVQPSQEKLSFLKKRVKYDPKKAIQEEKSKKKSRQQEQQPGHKAQATTTSYLTVPEQQRQADLDSVAKTLSYTNESQDNKSEVYAVTNQTYIASDQSEQSFQKIVLTEVSEPTLDQTNQDSENQSTSSRPKKQFLRKRPKILYGKKINTRSVQAKINCWGPTQ